MPRSVVAGRKLGEPLGDLSEPKWSLVMETKVKKGLEKEEG